MRGMESLGNARTPTALLEPDPSMGMLAGMACSPDLGNSESVGAPIRLYLPCNVAIPSSIMANPRFEAPVMLRLVISMDGNMEVGKYAFDDADADDEDDEEDDDFTNDLESGPDPLMGKLPTTRGGDIIVR